MSDEFAVIDERRRFSERRLEAIRSEIDKLPVIHDLTELCIYVTGSFGRLEASEHSDLDVFFVHGGSSCSPVPRIKKTLLDADLIRAVQKLEFPQFSNDGEYLVVHYIEDIIDNLGGPKDDFQNHFTARLLLLLESKSLFNSDFYKQVMKRIVDSYFRDYGDHDDSFRPVFLINDIIRFWRTLCLNYEHRRNRPDDDESKKNKNHLAKPEAQVQPFVDMFMRR